VTAEPSTERAPESGMTWPLNEYQSGVNEFTYSIDTPSGTVRVTDRRLAEDIAAIPIIKRMLADREANLSTLAHDLEATQAERNIVQGELDDCSEAALGTRMVPVQRSEHDLLVSLAQLLEESLAVQRHILAKLGQSTDSRSSVEVKTSTRGVDIAAKSYADSDVSAQVTPAVLAYFDTLEQVQARLNGGQS
jgi:hypothetical protein